jgi:hypothetical protein
LRGLVIGAPAATTSNGQRADEPTAGAAAAKGQTGCGCAQAAAAAQQGAVEDELSQHEWQAACAEATQVIQEAVEGINDTLEELRYAIAEMQRTAC